MDVRLTAEDLYRGYVTLVLRRSPWNLAMVLFGLGVTVAVNPWVRGPVSFVAAGGAFLFCMAVFVYWSAQRGLSTNRAYRHHVHYSFGEQGVDASAPTFSFHHDWCNFHAVVEDGRAILLCPSSSQLTVLPKRCLPDAAQLEALRMLLRAHVAGRVSLRRRRDA
jgi:hypothetical protein